LFISLLEYLINRKVIYIYTVDNKYWIGRIVFVWFDHLVLETSLSPKIIIPFIRIDDVRECDSNGNRYLLEQSLTKEHE